VLNLPQISTFRSRWLSSTPCTADGSALGRLIWLAFQGSGDDDYSAPGDADADAAGALAGR